MTLAWTWIDWLEDKERRIRPEIRALVERGGVTRAELAELRCNSWEWEALVLALDDDAFVEHVEHALRNCAKPRRPCSTYDEAIVAVHLPELLQRFQRALRERRDSDAKLIEALRREDGRR